MEKILEKIKENIDYSFCCCNCNKKFCYVWFIISLIISAFKYFILYFYIFYFTRINNNYYEEIINNWSSYPITNIEIYEGDDFSSNNIGIINGAKKNYFIHSLNGVNLKFEYDKDFIYNITVDLVDQLRYYDSYITYLTLINDNDFGYLNYGKNIPLGGGKYLHYSRGSSSCYVQSKFTATESLCENKVKKYRNDICSSLDNCNNGKSLLNKEKCLRDNTDDYYTKIGTFNLRNFMKDNYIDLKNEKYNNDTNINFFMRGYMELNKSDECIKNLTDTKLYINVKKNKKLYDILIFGLSTIMLIFQMILICNKEKLKEDYSDCKTKTLEIIFFLYFMVIIAVSVIFIIAFVNVDLIYLDFDKCIIPNLNKDFKFSKIKRFLIKFYPLVVLAIVLLEIIDNFTSCCKLFCKTYCCCCSFSE